MRRGFRVGLRGLLAIGVAVASAALALYALIGRQRTFRRDRGYERHLRRWVPVAMEFRARQIWLARLLVRLARGASQVGLLSPSRARTLESSVIRQVRFESRPVYASGRYGKWGDTGIRWRLQE